ncbi:hypothetical protein SAMN05660199_03080 [Klenkia soli]|uniref:Uncharacterized protein n=1 Tax=Klenkia soli TaxID=1052260 RepID=A0A1H0PFP1_9ACTN|nr:hypothetical protein [Klenkia soli]SDP03912.1 hypothetical protein SAMN05660199_03080 [Klenkia soli]
MRTRRLPVALTALAATAVVLAGCSSSPDDDTDAAERTSPLSVYLDAVYGGDLSDEELQAQYDDQNARVEEMVASCMQDEGFEYIPNTTNGGVVYSGDENVYEPDDRDWVSQYGYGAINYPGRDEQSSDPGQEYVDPNADYVASLSESEQQAFNESLYGPQPTEEEQAAMEDGSYEYDPANAGCYGAAQQEVYEADDLSQSEEFAPLFEEINSLYEDSQNSPELTALDAEWAACMDAAGHPGFTTQFDAQNSIYDAQNELWNAVPVDDEGMSTGEPDQAAMDALGEEEITLALADLDCREETDYRQRAEDIQFAVEEQFVADHKTELEALRAAAEQD